MTYEEARAYKQELEDQNKTYSDILNSFEKYPNGLTPDHIRSSPEWKEARKASENAFSELRDFNAWFVKTFKKEYAAERHNKRNRQ